MQIEDIEKLAKLARIEIEESEKKALLKDMEGILEFVGQISEVKIPEGEMDTPKLVNVMRDDDGAHEGGIFSEKLLAQVPGRTGTHVKVKKIL